MKLVATLAGPRVVNEKGVGSKYTYTVRDETGRIAGHFDCLTKEEALAKLSLEWPLAKIEDLTT